MPASRRAMTLRMEEELRRDGQLRTFFNAGSWIVSLTTIAILLILIMPLGRTSPWLLALSLYAIYTRVAYYIATKAFLYPRFLLDLDSHDADRRDAARDVLARHRTSIVRPILVNQLRKADDAALAATDPAEIAELARAHDIAWFRRLGLGLLAAWVVLTVAIWTTVVATGGGPTG